MLLLQIWLYQEPKNAIIYISQRIREGFLAPTVWWLTEWLTHKWRLTDCWMIADWLLTDCLKIWARKMKIESSRQVWNERTDGRTNKHRLWLLGLLSEPKTVFFQDCDNDFIRKALKNIHPDGFIPIWATDNLTEVTTHLMKNNSVFYHKYQQIVIGTEDSGEVLIELHFIHRIHPVLLGF